MDFDYKELGLELTEEQAAKLTSAFSAKLESEVTGLKNKRDEFRDKLTATKDQLTQFTSQFDGLDIEAVKSIVSKAGQDEESRLIAEGKLDTVVENRIQRLRQSMDQQLAQEKERADKSAAFAGRFKDKVLADSIRSAAIKSGALPEAMDDFILRAKNTFTLNDDGDAVAVAGDGSVVYGKDGKTPLSPVEWAESLRESAPHLWPRAQGAGPTGDRGGKASLKRSEMNPVQIHEYIQKHGRQEYLKLSK